jgi:SAM-dependent MidA family methyltransferase
VHRVTVEGGTLREIYVTWENGSLQEVMGPLSTPALQEYFQRLDLVPGEGCRAEVNLQALDWMGNVARALHRGFVLTFDYGYPAPELYVPWRRDGTLICFYRHNPSADPYARLGRQDITAHVDFTSLIRAGEEHGLETLGLTTQSRFLAALGVGAGLDSIARHSPEALEEYYARRRAVSELIDPASLGRIRVLVQARRVAPCELWGLKQPPGGDP